MPYAKLIGAAAIAAAVISGWFYVQGLRSDNARLLLENNNIGLKLTDQNAAVEKLKREADEKLAAAQVALEQARRETIVARKRAQEIFRAKPSTPTDLCKSALDLINGGVQ